MALFDLVKDCALRGIRIRPRVMSWLLESKLRRVGVRRPAGLGHLLQAGALAGWSLDGAAGALSGPGQRRLVSREVVQQGASGGGVWLGISWMTGENYSAPR